jgi:hypothetical protein
VQISYSYNNLPKTIALVKQNQLPHEYDRAANGEQNQLLTKNCHCHIIRGCQASQWLYIGQGAVEPRVDVFMEVTIFNISKP